MDETAIDAAIITRTKVGIADWKSMSVSAKRAENAMGIIAVLMDKLYDRLYAEKPQSAQ